MAKKMLRFKADAYLNRKGLFAIEATPDSLKKWIAAHEDRKNMAEASAEILKSWEKSDSLSIDYHRALPKEVAAVEFERVKKSYKRLMMGTDWVINHLIEDTNDPDLRVMLFSKDGILLRIYEKPSGYDWLRESGIKSGARWSEESIGANIFSMGMQLRHILMMPGYMNYSRFLVAGAYYYAPIYITESELGASLVLAVPSEKRAVYLSSVASSVARSIELDMFMFQSVEMFTSGDEDKGSIFMRFDEGKYKIAIITDQVFNILGIKKTDAYHLTLDDIILPLPENKEFWNIITNRKSVTDKSLQISVTRGRENVTITTATYRKNKFHPDGYTIFFSPGKGVGKGTPKSADNNARYYFSDIIGEDEQILDTVKRSKIAAISDSNILIQGESGVGKDVFAQAIHNASGRSHRPFVAINCAAFSKELIASELFGYESGAFTGARREGAIGKFEVANHGTLFLDEIGDMPMEVQSVLLRVLEEKNFRKVGGNQLIEVDVRIIAATNKNLRELIERKQFREDLFYRLSVIRINIPPLRKRGDDVFQFAQYYIKKLCHRMDRPKILLSQDALDYIGKYSWPGNIRELQNLLEGIVSTSEKALITRKEIDNYLGDYFQETIEEAPPETPPIDIYGIDEKERLQIALRKCRNNKSKAAEYLGLSRSTLYRRMQEFGLN